MNSNMIGNAENPVTATGVVKFDVRGDTNRRRKTSHPLRYQYRLAI